MLKKLDTGSLLNRIIIQVPIILGLIMMAITCFKWSLADIYVTQVNFVINKKNAATDQENIVAWHYANTQLKEALLLRPQHPQYLELAHNFFQTLYTLEIKAPNLMNALNWHDNETTALHYAQQALLLKPSWPYLWHELVISKVMLNQIDQVQAAAIERAVTLGPWQQSTHYQIALLGMHTWDRQTDISKQIIVKAFEQSMVINQIHPDKNKFNVLINKQNLAIACHWLKLDYLFKYPLLKKSCVSNSLL